MTVTVKPISPAGVAEITGFDCSRPTSREDMATLLQIFRDYPIVCIRDQHLTPKQQASFARQWGTLESQDRSTYCHPDDSDILILSNERREDGSQVGIVDAGDFWHSDSSHLAEPCRTTMLYSVKNPQRGGDTHFLNMTKVTQALPAELKARIAGRNAIHHVSKTLNPRVTISSEREGAADYYKAREKETKPVAQPMLRTHPETGRKSLLVNQRIRRFVGMSDEELAKGI